MLLTIFAFLIILSILVIVHELGHFMAAKYFGVEVQEFGLGFPPRAKIMHTSKDGVNWTLNWLPIGGFVKLKGEDGSHPDDPTSFAHKEPWKRTVILSAGVIMNIFLAFILLSIGYASGWPEDLTENHSVNPAYIAQKSIIVSFVEKNTPADTSGIMQGDIIKTVDGKPFVDVEPLQEFILNAQGKEILMQLERGKTVLEKKVTPFFPIIEILTFTFILEYSDIDNKTALNKLTFNPPQSPLFVETITDIIFPSGFPLANSGCCFLSI
jgi:regulator of sigma E protease